MTRPSSRLFGPRARAAAQAVAVAFVGFLLAIIVESTIVGMVRVPAREWEWISDALLASGLATATYLWTHLRETRDALLVAERARAAFEAEVSMAADIQRRLLPAAPAARMGVRLAARLEAARQIGGDFYDWVDLGPTVRVVLLGDISGKGIPAALLLAYTRAIFRQAVRESSSPAEIVRTLSSAIQDDTAGEPYVTCIVATFDLEARTVTYTNAGHPPGLLVADGGVRLFDAGGPPAGLLPRPEYAQEQVLLRDGDVGALFTDGVTESLDGDREALVALLAAARRAAQPSPDVLSAALLAAARRAGGPSDVERWDDDRTVVAFVVGPVADE